jgi:cytochrome c5
MKEIGMTQHMRKHAWRATLAAIAIATASAAWGADRTGHEVVETVCSACHADGKDGAPKIGDFAAWAQRAQGGFDKLSEHAISGKNKMPAHGGQSALTDLELTRAIAYMSSGGLAADPSKPYSQTKTIEPDVLVTSHCVKCHGTGVDGAPRLHEFSDWKPRVGKGVDALVHSAVAGHLKMPSRAGLPGLSDVDLRNAVTYMIVQSANAKPMPAH